jgi:cytidylate kinase
LADRVERTMERRNISRNEARKLISEMDERGANYVEAYFGRDLKDSLLYHVVLNTSKIPLDDCLELLELLARKMSPAPE